MMSETQTVCIENKCNICDYEASSSQALELHREYAHFGRKRKRGQAKEKSSMDTVDKKVFSCDQCEFTGSQTGLRLHKESKHVGVRYPCDQCEYAASQASNLKRHKKSKHEGVSSAFAE